MADKKQFHCIISCADLLLSMRVQGRSILEKLVLVETMINAGYVMPCPVPQCVSKRLAGCNRHIGPEH